MHPSPAPDSLVTLLRKLAQADFDPALLPAMRARLHAGLAHASHSAQRDWAAALRKLYEREPTPAMAFECGTLAALMLRSGTTIDFFRRSGPHAAARFNLGLQLRLMGHYEAAIAHMREALQLAPENARFADQLRQTEVHQQHCLALLPDSAGILSTENSILTATPLGRHHAQAWQRRLDAETARRAGLPWHASVPETRSWMRTRHPHAVHFALLHPEHGLVGGLGVEQRHNGALFHYWITPALRGQGFGAAALRLLKLYAGPRYILRIYSAVDEANTSSVRTLAGAGLRPIDALTEVTPGQNFAADYWACNLEEFPRDFDATCFVPELALLLKEFGA